MADGITEVPEQNPSAAQPQCEESGFSEPVETGGSSNDSVLPDGEQVQSGSGGSGSDGSGSDGSGSGGFGSDHGVNGREAPGHSGSAESAPLETEGEVAADYLEELLDVADLDGDIDTYIDNDRAQISVITDSTRLIGTDGEVLEALQELTRLAVTQQTGQRSRLMLDIGGHREGRRQKLTELATDVIHEVKTSGESVRLDPMNPFERKIVHDAVAAAGLSSNSDGAEPERRVVVRPSE